MRGPHIHTRFDMHKNLFRNSDSLPLMVREVHKDLARRLEGLRTRADIAVVLTSVAAVYAIHHAGTTAWLLVMLGAGYFVATLIEIQRFEILLDRLDERTLERPRILFPGSHIDSWPEFTSWR